MEDQKTPFEPANSKPGIDALSISDLILAVQFLAKEEARMAQLEADALPNEILSNFFYTCNGAFKQRVILNLALIERLSEITGIPAKSTNF